MAAKPPDDWWQVKYHTVSSMSIHTGVQTTSPGVEYVEAPDAATAKAKVAANKGIPLSWIDGVSGPMDPHTKDMAVGGNPVTGTVNAAKSAANAVKKAVTQPLDFLRNIAVFFDKLGQASTWLRIGEFLLGAALVIVGLAKLASGTAAGKAAKKIAVKAALL